MYCHHCGNELGENDKFCTLCGTAVPSSQTTDQPHAEDASEPGTSDSSEKDATATPEESAEDDQTATTTGSLKAAVASTRKRSRRKIPMIAVIGLAVALAASLALAAYYLYTQVYLPSTQETAMENNDPQWDEAVAAYQTIIDEYNEAIPLRQSESYESEDFDPYPHIAYEPLLSLGADAHWQYAFRDIDSDGTPEMLVGVHGSYPGDNTVYDIWAYKENGVVLVARGIARGCYCLRQDNVFLKYGTGGAKVNVYDFGRFSTANLFDYEDERNTGNFTPIEGIESDWGPTDNTTSYTRRNADGTTDSGTCTDDEYQAMCDEVFARYPEETDIEWHPLPTNGAPNEEGDEASTDDAADVTDDDESADANTGNTETDQEPPADAAVDTTPNPQTPPKVKAAAKQPTVQAYNKVIDQYKASLKKWVKSDDAADYPLVNPQYLSLTNGSARQLYYVERDLNGDGTPELLIGDDMPYSTIYGTIAIYDIWTYQNGKLEQVTHGTSDNTYSIRENNLVLIQGQDGTFFNGFKVCKPTSKALQAWKDGADTDKANFSVVEELQLDTGTFVHPRSAAIHTLPNGKVETKDCAAGGFQTMAHDLVKAYPEDTDLEWIPLSDN